MAVELRVLICRNMLVQCPSDVLAHNVLLWTFHESAGKMMTQA